METTRGDWILDHPVGARSALSPFPPTALLAKRVFDLTLAVPLTLLLVPVFGAIALAVRLESPGPVFFVQERRGRGMTPFRMIKFRSLRHNAPDPGERYEMVEEDPRITRVGRWLRSTSLDELPQLLNVLAGTMSLVGPRPLIEWESQQCWVRHPERFRAKPGITGLSQVTVRNSVDLDGRSDKDVEYVRNWSVWLDLRILLRTPAAVLRKTGIYPEEAS